MSSTDLDLLLNICLTRSWSRLEMPPVPPVPPVRFLRMSLSLLVGVGVETTYMASAYILGYPTKMQSDFKKALSSPVPATTATRQPGCPLCGSHVRYRGFTGMACAGPDTCPNIDPELPPARAKNKADREAAAAAEREAYIAACGAGYWP